MPFCSYHARIATAGRRPPPATAARSRLSVALLYDAISRPRGRHFCYPRLSDAGAGQHHLEVAAPAREREADHPVDRAREDIGLHVHADPGGVGQRGLGDAEQSRIETTSTSVVFFTSAMNSLVIAGSEIRSAWGRMISPVPSSRSGRARSQPRAGRAAGPAGRRAPLRPIGGDDEAEPDDGARQPVDADAAGKDQRQQE